MVFEVAPETGALASGTAAPYVTGSGFQSDDAVSCVWKSGSAKSVVAAEFIDDQTLRCKRPGASIALLLNDNIDLRVTISVVDGDGKSLVGATPVSGSAA
jgi:hypothetical protein